MLMVGIAEPRARRENGTQYVNLSINKCKTEDESHYIRILCFTRRSVTGVL